MLTLKIQSHDPLIVRDGRPFSFGDRMYSLDWPYPSTLAGMIRTLAGKLLAEGKDNPFKNGELLQQLKEIEFGGPFPVKGGKLYFPAPRDVIVYDKDKPRQVMPLRPKALNEGEGADLTWTGLMPVEVTDNVKPGKIPAFWSVDKIAEWLCQDPAPAFDIPDNGECFINALSKDFRSHVSIDSATSLAKDSELFVTRGLVFWEDGDASGALQEISIGARVTSKDEKIEDALKKIKMLHPFGGERRLSGIEHLPVSANGWEIPATVKEALNGASAVRMVLATPAIFEKGWQPDWLNENLEGSPPGLGVRLKLRGACVDRWKALSGWDLEKRKCKAVRRLVPAGSVYFFEVLEGQTGELAEGWLKSVCRNEQDRRDGFGLALWGVWNGRY